MTTKTPTRGARPQPILASTLDAAFAAVSFHSTTPLELHDGERELISLGEISWSASDAVSLVGQYAAHLALLRLCGITERFDATEWQVIRRKAADPRLIRVRQNSDVEPTSELTAIDEFRATVGGAALDTLDASWGRSDDVFIECFERLRDRGANASALASAAAGVVLAPGLSSLRAALSSRGVIARYANDLFVERLLKVAAMQNVKCIVAGGSHSSPLVPYSAFPSFNDVSSAASLAEQIFAETNGEPRVVVVRDMQRFDSRSREVLELLLDYEQFSWIVPRFFSHDATVLDADNRIFVVSPTLALAQSIRNSVDVSKMQPPVVVELLTAPAALETLLLQRGAPDLGVLTAPLPDEPQRSYLAALAIAGAELEHEFADEFLAGLGCSETSGILMLDVFDSDAGKIRFASESVRRRLIESMPAPYRESLGRLAVDMLRKRGAVAAAATTLLELGRYDELLELATTAADDRGVAAVLASAPRDVLRQSVVACNVVLRNLIADGRFFDALHLALPSDDAEHRVLCATAERRLGRYTAALERISGVDDPNARALRVELLRLQDRTEEALCLIDAALATASEEERDTLLFQKAIIALDHGDGAKPARLRNGYLQARLDGYVAMAAGDFAAARSAAERARDSASCVSDRLDAELDLFYASFLQGEWDDARHQARSMLAHCEETQGDRSAAGALFTLAFLSADEGAWSDAASRIDRLRHFYARFGDERRRRELDLLEAHLRFCRGDLDAALPLALTVTREVKGDVGLAAALIVDEARWIRGEEAELLCSTSTVCRELADRASLMQLRRGGTANAIGGEFNARLAEWETRVATGESADPPAARSTGERLRLFRSLAGWARARNSDGLRQKASALAAELSLGFVASPEISAPPDELAILQRVARDDFPFSDDSFASPWRLVSRSRVGTESQWGPAVDYNEELGMTSTMSIAENASLYVAGADRWSADTRDAVARVVRVKWEHHNQQRLLAPEESDVQSSSAVVDGIIGNSAPIRALADRILRVAKNDAPVTIIGESGTGKELVARALHRHSSRRGGPFIPVNCGALPENLIESELFGHAKGSFTGADRDRAGLIEAANGGTLFLDEIGELPLAAQAKLLRFLQEHEIRRVGDSTTRKADVRVVAATHRELEKLVDDGEFREDLFYRIKVIELSVPPLRERGGDIVLLARAFLATERAKQPLGPERFADHVEALFASYPWKGNVRELQNTVRAAFAIAGETRVIDVQHLPERVTSGAVVRRTGAYHDEVTRFRRALIENALQASSGNQNQASKTLGMSRQALNYQIRELRIDVSKFAR